jgi:hypothetical protein
VNAGPSGAVESLISGSRHALPARLIVSAPKNLMDQVGTDKMSPDAFKKAAKVE